jgi:hypothetical protein
MTIDRRLKRLEDRAPIVAPTPTSRHRLPAPGTAEMKDFIERNKAAIREILNDRDRLAKLQRGGGYITDGLTPRQAAEFVSEMFQDPEYRALYFALQRQLAKLDGSGPFTTIEIPDDLTAPGAWGWWRS